MGNQSSTTDDSIFNYTVETPQNEPLPLAKYRGKKAYIVVNVACMCGLTNSNYAALQQLYEKFQPDLEIIACPCNAFGGQEPAPNHEIVQFTQNKGVTFPVVGKLECENGDNTHPLYKMLRSSVSSGFADTILGQSIKWNFAKFLCDANGKPIKRYSPTTNPLSLEADIKALIAQAK